MLEKKSCVKLRKNKGTKLRGNFLLVEMFLFFFFFRQVIKSQVIVY